MDQCFLCDPQVRWMCTTDSAVAVKLLRIPVISGPTIGVSFFNEAEEWGRQIRRWIVGTRSRSESLGVCWSCQLDFLLWPPQPPSPTPRLK